MAEEVLQKSINRLREENSEQSQQIIKNTASTSEGVDGLKNTMKDLLDEFRGQAGDKEESRKKSLKKSGAVAPRAPDFEREGGSILNILIGLPTALLGFATGLARGWSRAVFDVGKTIGKIIRSTFKTILGGIRSILRIFSAPFVLIADDIAKATKGFRSNIVRRVKDILGFFKNIINVFRLDLTPLIDAFKKIPNAIKSATQFVTKTLGVFKLDFKPLVNGFTNVSNAVKAGANGVSGLSRTVSGAFRPLNGLEKSFRSFGKSAKSVSTFITTSFTKISTIFKNVGNTFKGVGSFTTGISETFSKLIQPMKNTVNYLKTVAPGIFKAFSALGRLFGWPLTIAIGLYEGIKSSLDSFRAGDILGGVMQFLTGAINGAVLSLVDMIKDGVSWIAAKIFGENNPVTTFLDSFDFTEMFTNFMENATQFIRAIPEKITAMVDGIKEWWSGLMESEDPIGYLMEPIQQLIRDIKDFVLGLIPSMDDIKSFASGAFDSVKGFFGGKTEEDKEKEAAVYRERISSAEQKLAENPNDKDALIIKEKSQASLDKMDNRVEPVEDASKYADGTERRKPRSEMTAYERKMDRMDRTEERLSRTNSTPQTSRGQELTDKSKENALSSGVSVNVVNAPTSQNVTNNSQSTAAIMDKNMPTVDYNDRTWAFG